MKTTRNNIIVSPLVNGVKYIIHNVNDEIQQKVQSGHQWNNEIFSLIKSYISTRNLSHFLNIGSHIGTVILPISLHINKVTAVEAYPSTYVHLRQNIKLNNISNIQTFRLALGNSIEDVYFMSKNKICPVENVNRVKNNSGGMHVFTENDIQHNIRSSCLTDKKIKNQMNKLDNIKLVDIEGSEHDFLLGAEEKIKKNRPIIIIEIWDDNKRKNENMTTTQNEIINYILSLNYTLIKNIHDDFIFEPK
jgi:FkbM family methyltransferase